MNHLKEASTALVVGATGATGRHLVKQLLDRGLHVKAVARQSSTLPDQLTGHDRLTVIRTNLLELPDSELEALTAGCQSVASCLGHNMTWRGVFGKPRRLVTDTLHRLTNAITSGRAETPVRLVLMNSAGCSDRNIKEPVSRSQRFVIATIRLLIPPHADNEEASDYLRKPVGYSNSAIEWVVVRPDSLSNEDTVTNYPSHPSPTRSAIFDPGSTSRINVAHFMAELITNDRLWRQWRGQMPVIYNH